MRILFVGDSPTVSSGFARCTAAACGELHARGHEVHVLGLSYWGDPHDFPYRIWPPVNPLVGAKDWYAVERLASLAAELSPDVVVVLTDPWNIPAYVHAIKSDLEDEEKKLDQLRSMPELSRPEPKYSEAIDQVEKRIEELDWSRVPVVGWLAVDSKNQRGSDIEGLDQAVVWTDFALDELASRIPENAQGKLSVVPLGVDPIFEPKDRAESRANHVPATVPDDAFIVGVVGRNQPRKRMDLTLEYFAAWLETEHHDNAWLYLHVAPTGERGYDLPSLVSYHGLTNRVILAEPDIGVGNPIETMPYLYSAFDVYLSTSQGEGWGLPALEAMACGVPCILPDSSAFGSWVRGAALKVPCTATAITAPLNGSPYTVGAVPDKVGAVEALQRMHENRDGIWDQCKKRGFQIAAEHTWQRTGSEFCDLLERYGRQALKAVTSG